PRKQVVCRRDDRIGGHRCRRARSRNAPPCATGTRTHHKLCSGGAWGGILMSDATTRFFADLGSIDHHPLLAKASGSLRFELSEGEAVERWRVQGPNGECAAS